jgi:superfamily II DNA/RNA helicase
MSFNLLNQKIQDAIALLGHEAPTPIQEQAIPKVIEGCDLQASAQTGTGKTAAFLLPSIHKIANPLKGKGPRVLILVPTRELAMQVATEAAKYTKFLPHIKTVCIYGGMPYPKQNQQLAKPYDILVATPGRLIDHIERNRISLSRVEMLILDEADRMLDMGFVEPVEYIASLTPENRQTLLFSATLKGTVLKLSQKLLKNPVQITIAPQAMTHETIEQQLHTVDNIDHKYRLLDHILENENMTQVIVFTATKNQADELADKLGCDGHPAGALHGDMNQRQRTRTIARLRKGEIRILVATDVAARGIDIPSISHVVNFDLPRVAEDYVHRIGRTGRAGATGIALSFAAHRDMGLVRQIEKFTGKKMVPTVIAGMEPKSKPMAPKKKSFGPPRRKFRSR